MVTTVWLATVTFNDETSTTLNVLTDAKAARAWLDDVHEKQLVKALELGTEDTVTYITIAGRELSFDTAVATYAVTEWGVNK